MKNQNIAFLLTKKKLRGVSSEDERIRVLEELVSLNPKGRQDLEQRSGYKKELEILKRKRTGRGSGPASIYQAIAYERQVALLGLANSGKSTLLARLTGATPVVSEAPYTTYRPEVGMLSYLDVPIQLIEIPPLYPGDQDPAKWNFIRKMDVLALLVRNEDELNTVNGCLEDYLIIGVGRPSPRSQHQYKAKDDIIEKPAFAASWTPFHHEQLGVVDVNDPLRISEEVYRLLNIMRIYSFIRGEIAGHPVVFSRDDEPTVRDFSDRLRLKGVKGARLFGDIDLYEGEAVGLDYKLKDGAKVCLR